MVAQYTGNGGHSIRGGGAVFGGPLLVFTAFTSRPAVISYLQYIAYLMVLDSIYI